MDFDCLDKKLLCLFEHKWICFYACSTYSCNFTIRSVVFNKGLYEDSIRKAIFKQYKDIWEGNVIPLLKVFLCNLSNMPVQVAR